MLVDAGVYDVKPNSDYTIPNYVPPPGLVDQLLELGIEPEEMEIPIVKAANSKTPSEKQAVVLANLKQRGSSKPRTVKTLSSTISSPFQKTLTDKELEAILKGMQEQGFISISDTKVSYALPA